MNNAATDDFQWKVQECQKVIGSFEYFLDEYVYIEDKATNQPIKLALWPAQRDTIPVFLDEQFIIFLKAHQLGYTWLFVAAYGIWKSITTPMHQMIVNSFNEDVGKEIIDRCRFILNRLPEWLYPPISKNSTLEIEFMHQIDKIDSPSNIEVIPATEKGGQSKTPNIMVFDESCWNRYFAMALNGSLPGIKVAKGRIIVISNAIKNAPGWPFTRGIYVGAMRNTNNFKNIFLPWWANPNRSRRILYNDDGSVMLDGKQQPMTEFKFDMLRSGGKDGGRMDEEDFEQRYPETETEAISIMGGSFFSKVLNRHDEHLTDGLIGKLFKSQAKDIEFKEDSTRGNIEFWRFPYYLLEGWDHLYWRNRYAIGSDVSEGLGESYSVAYVYDRHLEELVARMRSNRIDAHKWGTMLYWLSLFYDRALIVPERTGAGITAVKRLQDLNGNVFSRLIAGKAGDPTTQELGWSETHQAKHELAGDLKTWLGAVKTPAVYCNLLIDECSTYILDEHGRLNPEEGHFGDCVIAAGLAIQGDLALGRKPEIIDPGPSGWLKEWQEGEKDNWTK